MSISKEIIKAAINEVNQAQEDESFIDILEDSVLMGSGSSVDSLTLVRLIVTIERITEEKIGKEITIVDDSAFDAGNSPFSSVGSLTSHLELLIQS